MCFVICQAGGGGGGQLGDGVMEVEGWLPAIPPERGRGLANVVM